MAAIFSAPTISDCDVHVVAEKLGRKMIALKRSPAVVHHQRLERHSSKMFLRLVKIYIPIIKYDILLSKNRRESLKLRVARTETRVVNGGLG